MGFFRRARSVVRRNGEGGAINSASAWRAPPVDRPMVDLEKPPQMVYHSESDETDTSRSLGEPLASADQFELEIPMKNKSPVGILRNSSAKSVDLSFHKRRCMPKLPEPQQLNVHTARVSSKLSRDLDIQSTISSITIETYYSHQQSQQTSTRQVRKGKGKLLPPNPETPTTSTREYRDFGSCCGYTTDCTAETDDVNSLVDGENKKGSQPVQGNGGTWMLCGARADYAAEAIDDDLASQVLAVRPIRRERSLFDTLQDEPEEEEGADQNTHIAVAETPRTVKETEGEDAETQSVATSASKKEKKRKLKLPKELVRGLSLVKVKSVQSFRRLKGLQTKDRGSKLQQYSVDQYTHR